MKPELHTVPGTQPAHHTETVRSGQMPVRQPAAGSFSQLHTRYDPHSRAIWVWMNPSPRPCLNPQLVDELSRLQHRIHALYHSPELYARYPFTHVVLASRIPGIYCYGGDLELFQQLILSQNRSGLRQYAHQCVRTLHRNTCNLDLPITIISLLQGQALGGGFEAALSCDVLIAERHSRMGFPERLFNLFPGMGAYNLLSRRINPGLAERMILSGDTYSAEQLYDMGIIDMLVEPGEGVVATESYLQNRNRAHHCVRYMKQVRRMSQPLDLQTLLDIVDLWVDAAMQLDSRDLFKMKRLLYAQNGLRKRPDTGSNVIPMRRRGEWRKQTASHFPLITHMGETVTHNRRRNRGCRRCPPEQ